MSEIFPKDREVESDGDLRKAMLYLAEQIRLMEVAHRETH